MLSDVYVKLFKEAWFVTDRGSDFAPKALRMKKEVVVGVQDVKKVDNDFFLVVVKILDQRGPLFQHPFLLVSHAEALKLLFPDLFRLSKNKYAVLKDMVSAE